MKHWSYTASLTFASLLLCTHPLPAPVTVLPKATPQPVRRIERKFAGKWVGNWGFGPNVMLTVSEDERSVRSTDIWPGNAEGISYSSPVNTRGDSLTWIHKTLKDSRERTFSFTLSARGSFVRTETSGPYNFEPWRTQLRRK